MYCSLRSKSEPQFSVGGNSRTLSGELPSRAWVSIKVLLQGYAIGMVLALLLTVLAMASRLGNDLLETLTAMLNSLPAIARLPLALIWFGLGSASIVFVLVHALLWPVALNTQAGVLAVRVIGLAIEALVFRTLEQRTVRRWGMQN